MTRLPSREQIATAIVKSGETTQSFDEWFAALKTISVNECRWILHRYPNVLSAMNS